MLRLFIKDKTDGKVHEYGTDKHDSLVVMDGVLQYENLQNGCCTPETYEWCHSDGTPPAVDDYGSETVNIGGDYYENGTLRKAIETYGIHAQVDMAIEEMSELTKALCKERRTELKQGNHAEALANVIEEIADVSIMLRQLIMIFDKDNELPAEIEYKIKRLAQRIERSDTK